MKSKMFPSKKKKKNVPILIFQREKAQRGDCTCQTHTTWKASVGRPSRPQKQSANFLSKPQPCLLLSPLCISHPRIFWDPGPLGKGRSLLASQTEYTQDSINTSSLQTNSSGSPGTLFYHSKQENQQEGEGCGGWWHQPGKLKTDPDLQPKANGNIRRHSAGSLRTSRGTQPERQAEGHLQPHGRPFA